MSSVPSFEVLFGNVHSEAARSPYPFRLCWLIYLFFCQGTAIFPSVVTANSSAIQKSFSHYAQRYKFRRPRKSTKNRTGIQMTSNKSLPLGRGLNQTKGSSNERKLNLSSKYMLLSKILLLYSDAYVYSSNLQF